MAVYAMVNLKHIFANSGDFLAALFFIKPMLKSGGIYAADKPKEPRKNSF